MGHWLRVLAALAENPGSLLAWGSLTTTYNSSSRGSFKSSDLHRHQAPGMFIVHINSVKTPMSVKF